MKYDQKKMILMRERLKSIRDGEKFKLNKNDVCPITVTLKRTGATLSLIDAEVGNTMATCYGDPKNDKVIDRMVSIMLEYIEDWDRTTKAHFADLARKEGLDY